MVETTNLVLANKSESLRTTVPAHIARQFKLKAGDRLAWEMVVEDGRPENCRIAGKDRTGIRAEMKYGTALQN